MLIKKKLKIEMNIFLNKKLNKYHKHSFIIDKLKINNNNNNNNNNLTPMPKFYCNDNILRIKYYHFIGQNESDKQKIIKLVKNEINQHKNIKNIIIDLRLMTGGNMVPILESLFPILKNNTLFGISNKKVKKTDKLWTNLNSNGKIIFNGKYKINNLKYNIAILTSNKTISSGEIITSAFIKRNNCIIIGYNKFSYGHLSVNDFIPLKNDWSGSKATNLTDIVSRGCYF
jgi:C-terminal processing protease CtpA/Prc